MILYCGHCGYIWRYTGKRAGKAPGTACPSCLGYVPFSHQVDTRLPDVGDYSGAFWLGVARDNSVVYYDPHYDLVVAFVGEPDPFSRSVEQRLEGSLEDYMKDVGWAVGWKYHISHEELEDLEEERRSRR